VELANHEAQQGGFHGMQAGGAGGARDGGVSAEVGGK
jgi:hypothetical protein